MRNIFRVTLFALMGLGVASAHAAKSDHGGVAEAAPKKDPRRSAQRLKRGLPQLLEEQRGTQSGDYRTWKMPSGNIVKTRTDAISSSVRGKRWTLQREDAQIGYQPAIENESGVLVPVVQTRTVTDHVKQRRTIDHHGGSEKIAKITYRTNLLDAQTRRPNGLEQIEYQDERGYIPGGRPGYVIRDTQTGEIVEERAPMTAEQRTAEIHKTARR